jgi:hypothetical protein
MGLGASTSRVGHLLCTLSRALPAAGLVLVDPSSTVPESRVLRFVGRNSVF